VAERVSDVEPAAPIGGRVPRTDEGERCVVVGQGGTHDELAPPTVLLAVGVAAVAWVVVAVVAGLAFVDFAVAADLDLAAVAAAAITVVGVVVVAVLLDVDDAITAARKGARRAARVGRSVGVQAALVAALVEGGVVVTGDNAVTAAGGLAYVVDADAGRAGVAVGAPGRRSVGDNEAWVGVGDADAFVDHACLAARALCGRRAAHDDAGGDGGHVETRARKYDGHQQRALPHRRRIRRTRRQCDVRAGRCLAGLALARDDAEQGPGLARELRLLRRDHLEGLAQVGAGLLGAVL